MPRVQRGKVAAISTRWIRRVAAAAPRRGAGAPSPSAPDGRSQLSQRERQEALPLRPWLSLRESWREAPERVRSPAGSQRQQMPFAVTPPPVKMRLERPCGCAAMKAPVGLSSRRAVCDSRWKDFVLTSVGGATNAKLKIIFPLILSERSGDNSKSFYSFTG